MTLKRFSDRDFDAEWRSSFWDYMRRPGHCPNYGVLASYLWSQRVESVLDVGCGDGTMAEFLPFVRRYHGCDISPTSIDRAREKFPSDTHRFCVADLETFPETLDPSERYDCLLFKDSLYLFEHGKTDRILSTYLSHLEPSGVVALSVHEPHESISASMTHLNGRLARDEDPSLSPGVVYPHMDSLFALLSASFTLEAAHSTVNWHTGRYPLRHFFLWKR